MSKIAVSSDTTCAISKENAKKLGLFLLPLNVIVDGVEFHDGIDIDHNTLASKMRGDSDIKTSTPTPFEITSFFDEVFAQGYDKVIHFTISSHLSSMFDLFTKTCADHYGDKVVVINSLAVCSLMLNNVLSTIEDVKKNLPIEEIAKRANQRALDGSVYFIPENLTALKKGGRISPAVAIIGNLIGIKPILIFKEGKIEKDSTTRKIKVALIDRASTLIGKFPADKYDYQIVIFDTNPQLVSFLKSALSDAIPESKIAVTNLSINVCAHVGPGTIGLIAARKIDDKYTLTEYLGE